MKVKKLYNAEDFTMNRLYMFISYNKLNRGFCTSIMEKEITFSHEGRKTTLKYKECNGKQTYFAEYNAEIFRKYQKLVDFHKQEINDLLEHNVYKREKDIKPEPLKKSKKNRKFKNFLSFIFTLYCFLCGMYYAFVALMNGCKLII